jgi:hypothetical protein
LCSVLKFKTEQSLVFLLFVSRYFLCYLVHQANICSKVREKFDFYRNFWHRIIFSPPCIIILDQWSNHYFSKKNWNKKLLVFGATFSFDTFYLMVNICSISHISRRPFVIQSINCYIKFHVFWINEIMPYTHRNYKLQVKTKSRITCFVFIKDYLFVVVRWFRHTWNNNKNMPYAHWE